jgi:dipeptidyl aminopeptidase/acylaminoacyl peptidase
VVRSTLGGVAPDIRAYLQIRTAGPSGFNRDGSKLLISSNLPGTFQVHRLDIDRLSGGPVEAADLVQVTTHSEPVGASYLPDADRLLLVTDAGGDERHQILLGPDDPPRPLTYDDLEPLIVDREHIHRPGGVTRDGARLAYATNRRDGVAFDAIVRDMATGAEHAVWERGGAVFPGGWSPQGRWLAVSELTDRPGDNRVHLLTPDGARAVEVFPHDHGPEASVSTPAWLPDESACFVGSSVGREFRGVFRIPVGIDGIDHHAGEPVSDARGDCGCAIDWTGRHLLVTCNADGITRAELRDPDDLTKIVDIPLPGAGVAGPFVFSKDGRWLAYGFSSATIPGDVWRYSTVTGATARLTVSPCDVDPATFVPPDLVRVPSFDGLQVPAFVFRPRGVAGRHPVVVVVHGGPESQWRPSFSPLVQYLVAGGFAVVAPNVRGSTGYGRTYQHLDDVDKRLDSLADLAALHDWIATCDDLDEDRCALYGGSYGGYMVLSGLVHQPERWAAGVDVVGIANLVTFLQNTAAWRRAWREREYGSLTHDRELLERLSPIAHVERLRAPLMVVHGRNDPRVPLGEAEQIHAVARAKGLPSELLVYDDEGHGLAKLRNRLDAYPRVAAFLHEVLAPRP